MEEKCFVNGCKNSITFRWEISNNITTSCGVHKILDHETLAKSTPQVPSFSHPPTSYFIYLQSFCIFIVLFLIYQSTSNQNDSIHSLAAQVQSLQTTSDVNYRFYSEIFAIKELLENPSTPSVKSEKSPVEEIVKEIKQEITIFSEVSYTKELSKKEAKLILSNPSSSLATRAGILDKNFGIFLDEKPGEVLSISFISETEVLVGSMSGSLNYLNLTSLEYKNLNSGKFRVYSIAVSADLATVLTSGDSALHIFSLSSMKYIKMYNAHQHWVLSTIISNDNQWVVTGSCDKTISIWNHETYQLDGQLIAHTQDVWSLFLSQENLFLASAGEDSLVILWDFKKRKIIKTFVGHTSPVYSVCITNDNKFIVSGSGDGTIRIWQVASVDNPIILQHTGMVRAVLLVKNDKYLVSCANLSVKIWDFQKKTLKFELFHPAKIISIRVSPDWKWLISGDSDNRIWLWDFATGTLKWVFGGVQDSLLNIEISDDFKWILLGENGVVRIWNTSSGKPIGILTKKKQVDDWDSVDLSRFVKYLN